MADKPTTNATPPPLGLDSRYVVFPTRQEAIDAAQLYWTKYLQRARDPKDVTRLIGPILTHPTSGQSGFLAPAALLRKLVQRLTPAERTALNARLVRPDAAAVTQLKAAIAARQALPDRVVKTPAITIPATRDQPQQTIAAKPDRTIPSPPALDATQVNGLTASEPGITQRPSTNPTHG